MTRDSLPRKLRRQPTQPEIRFWRLIHPLREEGWHFRKQAPIGRYVVDFVCHRAALVIEIDGDSHFSPDGMARDVERTRFLTGERYRVLRFTNLDVMAADEGVFGEVVRALDCAGSTPPGLPHQGGGEEFFGLRTRVDHITILS